MYSQVVTSRSRAGTSAVTVPHRTRVLDETEIYLSRCPKLTNQTLSPTINCFGEYQNKERGTLRLKKEVKMDFSYYIQIVLHIPC